MAEPTEIQLARDGGLAVLTLNRSQVLNALGVNICTEIISAAETLSADTSVRVVILTGAGEKAFCAGADLKERQGKSEEELRAHNRKIFRAVQAISALPVPVIGAINGYALGGGCELALACDLRIAAETAFFGLTEVTLGIIPAAGGTQRLPRLIGRARAKELIFTGKRIDARRAEAIGLVNAVVPAAELLPEARRWADLLQRNAPLALRGAKRAIDEGSERSLAEGLELEAEIQFALYQSQDWKEGLAAWSAKRPPVYRGE